jgi:hypothetical protein
MPDVRSPLDASTELTHVVIGQGSRPLRVSNGHFFIVLQLNEVSAATRSVSCAGVDVDGVAAPLFTECEPLTLST